MRPNSGRQEILKIAENEYKVFLKKSPESGKANLELEKLLSKHFGKEVKIIKGASSRKKLIEVKDGD